MEEANWVVGERREHWRGSEEERRGFIRTELQYCTPESWPLGEFCWGRSRGLLDFFFSFSKLFNNNFYLKILTKLSEV